MDYKEIVGLALDGKDYSEKIKDFTEDQKKELDMAITKGAKEEKEKTLTDLSALRKEKNRVKDLAVPPVEPPKEVNVMDQFKKEQEDEATHEFFSNPDFVIPEDKKATFNEVYKSLKKDEVSKSQVTQVLKRAYAATLGDELIESKKRVTEMEKGAEAFKAGGANHAIHVSGPDAQKYSKEAQALFTSWQQQGYVGKNYTLDRAAQITSGGMDRRI